MSEQQAQQTSTETGAVGAAPAASPSSDVQGEVVGSAQQIMEDILKAAAVESPGLVPGKGEGTEPSKVEAVAAPEKADPAKARADKPEVQKPDAPRPASRLMIMSPADRTWDRPGAAPDAASEAGTGMFGKRRVSAMAAVVALAAIAGALGGAMATVGLGHFGEQTAVRDVALEASVARIDADIVALKASVEHTSKVGLTQFNKTTDRLDKVEKAQAEPLAKIARLSEAVDKLRAAPAAAPAPVAAAPAAAAPAAPKEVTGSIAPPAIAPAPASAAKSEIARLPTVEGWVLRDVANGGALIESRRGIFEVYAGDPVPGLGRVDAVRKQDGRWVVVTSKGLIVAR